jgi:hypothetical protein
MDSKKNNNDRYVLVKAKGGMGNRMLCALTGILYGELTGRRVVVDWRDAAYSNDGSNSFTRFFSHPSIRPEAALPKDATLRPAIWKGHMDRSMSQMIHEFDPDKHTSMRIHRKYSVDVRRLYYPENVVVFWNYSHCMHHLEYHLRGTKHRYAGLSATQIIQAMLRNELALNQSIQKRVAEFKKANWSDTVIGVHIRHTTERRTNLRKYERHLAAFLKKVPKAKIFLATDNHMVMEDYRKRYQNIFSTAKWFPEDESAMHQNTDCPDRLANGIDALVDMYLLAECDYLIYPGISTFSRISHLLSDAPQEQIVDIQKHDPKVRITRLVRKWLT